MISVLGLPITRQSIWEYASLAVRTQPGHNINFLIHYFLRMKCAEKCIPVLGYNFIRKSFEIRIRCSSMLNLQILYLVECLIFDLILLVQLFTTDPNFTFKMTESEARGGGRKLEN